MSRNALDTLGADLLGEFHTHLEAQALKYHCSVEIFCPLCNSILDCRRAVEVDIIQAANAKLLRTSICCANCYDSKVKSATARLVEQDAFKKNFELRVQDGREFQKQGLL